MKIIKFGLLIYITILFLTSTFTAVAQQATQELNDICNSNNKVSQSSLCAGYNEGKNQSGNPVIDIIVDVINILLFFAGALAVIYVIYGGFKYTKSGGDSNKVSEAKNTILYALVGLVLALIANRLIIFIINWFFK